MAPIILTARQAAGLEPLGINFATHPDFLVWDPNALDATDIIIRPGTAERMRYAEEGRRAAWAIVRGELAPWLT